MEKKIKIRRSVVYQEGTGLLTFPVLLLLQLAVFIFKDLPMKRSKEGCLDVEETKVTKKKKKKKKTISFRRKKRRLLVVI